MTRFARAQGSKASNAKVPEEATPWSEMKRQLLHNKTGNQSPPQNTKSANDIVSSFYEDEKAKSSSNGTDIEWAEFGQVPVVKKGKKKKVKGNGIDGADNIHHVNDSGKIKKKKKPIESTVKLDGVQAALLEISMSTFSKDRNAKTSVIPKESNALSKNNSIKGKKEVSKEKKRRKPIIDKIFVENREIEIEIFDGFPVKKEDATRLKALRKRMLETGVSKMEMNKSMKLERRRAEKALSREKRKVCFHCRGSGHMMSECPQLESGSCAVCFKCGSTEHKSQQCRVSRGDNYKYGHCFVCGEQGHISRQCPDNPRGLYPQGGSCKVCGDVTHLKKDCPKLAEERRENAITLPTTWKSTALEALDDDSSIVVNEPNPPRKNKIIKF